MNAFTSRELVDWIEGKLRKHKIGKVILDEATLAKAYGTAFVHQSVRSAIPGLRGQAKHSLEAARSSAGDLRKRVAALLRKDADLPWDRAVARIAGEALADEGNTT